MSDNWQIFCMLMVLMSPIWEVAIYVTVEDWIRKLRRHRPPPVTFGLDRSWFEVDPQKLREWRELNRGKGKR